MKNNSENKYAPNQSKKMLKKMKKGASPIVYILLIIWAFVCVFPIYYLFTFSLKSNSEIFKTNPLGLPKEWLWDNYLKAFKYEHGMGLKEYLNLKDPTMLTYFGNSALVSVVTIAITIICALMATYALTRMKWPGRKLANDIFMLGLTIPIHAALLPVFLLFKQIGLLNTRAGLIIPYAAFALSMAIMIFGSFMENIPYELEESACIDGCGTFGIFFKIILPLMVPALSTVAIFTFLSAWNELMFANTFISKGAMRTLPVGVNQFFGSYTTDWGPIGAALCIATFPTLLVYFFISKKVQDSLIAGAVKG